MFHLVLRALPASRICKSACGWRVESYVVRQNVVNTGYLVRGVARLCAFCKGGDEVAGRNVFPTARVKFLLEQLSELCSWRKRAQRELSVGYGNYKNPVARSMSPHACKKRTRTTRSKSIPMALENLSGYNLKQDAERLDIAFQWLHLILGGPVGYRL